MKKKQLKRLRELALYETRAMFSYTENPSPADVAGVLDVVERFLISGRKGITHISKSQPERKHRPVVQLKPI